MTNLYIENNDLTAAEMSSNRSSLLQVNLIICTYV